jgi:hypothetical protein
MAVKKSKVESDGDYTFTFDGVNLAECKIKAMLWNDNFAPLSEPKTKSVSEDTDVVLESDHPYADFTNDIKSYQYTGECESIDVTLP